MSHTPGPWGLQYESCEEFSFGFCVVAEAVTEDGEKDWATIAALGKEPDYISPEEQEANAQLIAAAPDLLEACKAARDALEGFTLGTFPEKHTLEAAIAKAVPLLTIVPEQSDLEIRATCAKLGLRPGPMP